MSFGLSAVRDGYKNMGTRDECQATCVSASKVVPVALLALSLVAAVGYFPSSGLFGIALLSGAGCTLVAQGLLKKEPEAFKNKAIRIVTAIGIDVTIGILALTGVLGAATAGWIMLGSACVVVAVQYFRSRG